MSNYLQVRLADNVVDNIIVFAGDPATYNHSDGHYLDVDPAGLAQKGWQKIAGTYQPTAAVIAAAGQAKSASLLGGLQTQLAAGVAVTDPTNGSQTITMPADTASITNVNGGLSLINLVNPAGTTLISTIFGAVLDVNGGAHDMTVAQYKTLVVSYGQAIGALRDALLAKLGQLASATTLAQINAV